jgi:hypothetical protein
VGNLAVVLSVGYMIYRYDYGGESDENALEPFRKSRLALFDTGNPSKIKPLDSVEIDGDLIDSISIGEVIYTVAVGKNDIILTSFRVSEGTQLRRIEESRVSSGGADALGYTRIYPTREFIFIASPVGTSRYSYDKTRVDIFDIRDPGGRIGQAGWIELEGLVADKFKMDLYKGLFRVIHGTRFSNKNYISIYDISGGGIRRLSRLGIGTGESLFATAFDGDRAYVVTYRRKDPLWVLDLADPYNPRIAGELVVPGWSQYIKPLGDRLVALGIDDSNWSRKAMVSLFDVSNPAKPTELGRVSVGKDWSTSYGLADYKAFNIMPEIGLIILPFTEPAVGWWSWLGTRDKAAVINYSGDSLELKSDIGHLGTVERSFVEEPVLFLQSQNAVQSVSIENRAAPEMLSLLNLLTPVYKVKRTGNILVLDNGGNWFTLARRNGPALETLARMKIPADAFNADFLGDSSRMLVTTHSSGTTSTLYFFKLKGATVVSDGCVAVTDRVLAPAALLGRGGKAWLLESLWGSYSRPPSAIEIDFTSSPPVVGKYLAYNLPSTTEYYFSAPAVQTGDRFLCRTIFQSIPEITETMEYSRGYSHGYTMKEFITEFSLGPAGEPRMRMQNFHGRLSHLSADGRRAYSVKSDRATQSFELFAARLSQGLDVEKSAVYKIMSDSVRFSDRWAVAVDYSSAYKSPAVKVYDIANPEKITEVVQDEKNPVDLKYMGLAGIINDYVFFENGSFENIVTYRDETTSQGAWYSAESYHLRKVYKITGKGLVFDHYQQYSSNSSRYMTYYGFSPQDVSELDGVTYSPLGLFGIEIGSPSK